MASWPHLHKDFGELKRSCSENGSFGVAINLVITLVPVAPRTLVLGH